MIEQWRAGPTVGMHYDEWDDQVDGNWDLPNIQWPSNGTTGEMQRQRGPSQGSVRNERSSSPHERRLRGASPPVNAGSADTIRRLQEDLAMAQRQIALLANQGVRPVPAILDGPSEKEYTIDIKQLARLPDIHMSLAWSEFRSWIQTIVHGMVLYDTKGAMAKCCSEAVSLRGEKQQALKFREYGHLNQAMAILGSKFMNEANFKHIHFGPLLETYGNDCLKQHTSPKAPYILSCVSVFFDTSSGSWMTEKDLYVIRCGGPSLEQLTAFIHQVDYTTSQIKEGNLPGERARFDWFYGEVQP